MHSAMPPGRHALRVPARARRLSVVGAAALALLGGGLTALQLQGSASGAESSYSIWGDQRPVSGPDKETAKVTLGVKFSSKVAGQVTGLRFYKFSADQGVHTGQLWSSRGKALATITYSGETASGWQTARLSSPVDIKAATTYVASYTVTGGRYADDTYSLSSRAPKTTKSLTATQGVYTYGRGMPTKTWHNSNYYADVLFAESGSSSSTPTAPSTAPTTTAPAPAPSSSAPTTSAPTTAAPTTSAPKPPATTSSAPTTSAPPPASSSSAPTSPSTGFPTASTTGVPAGTNLTTVSGGMSACGTVDRKDITGDLKLTCDTTLTNSHVRGKIVQNGHKFTATDSTIGPDACGSSGNSDELVDSDDFSLTRVHVQHSGSDLVRLVGGGGTITINDSLIDGACMYPGDHLDALQYYDPGSKANVTIKNSSIDSRATNTSGKGNAAIFLADNPGRGSVFNITGNRLAGGNYTASLYDALSGSGVTYKVTGNTFVKGSWTYGPCSMSNSNAYNGTDGVEFSGNKYDDGSALNKC
jgi:hypothetical protein